MKTTNSFFPILTITAVLAMQVHAQTFLTNGLVAYYPFNGNAIDVSGNGNNGIVQGATLTTNRFGAPNSAYAFDGVQSRIQIPENIFTATNTAVTISLWVTTDNGPYTGIPNILEKSGLNGAVAFQIETNRFEFGAYLSTHISYWASSPMVSNSVTQLVGVYQQGQGVWLYINGVLAGSLTGIPNLTLWVDTSGYQLVSAIGIYDWTPAPYNGFRGVIDDVRVYTRAFSASEVQQLYQYESVKQTPPMNHPSLLDINFGGADTNKVGFAAIGETINDYWNGYQFGQQTYGAVTNLKWADRSDSGMNITVLNAPGVWGNNTGDGMYDVFIYPWDNGNVTTTLSNVPAASYDFYLYGHSANAWENSKFQMTIGTNTTEWKQTQDSTFAATSTNWAEGVQYVVFRNIVISSNQPAVITCAPGDQWNAILNGLQMISSSGQQTPPIITSFAPTSAFLGSNVVINGLNFSPVTSNNIVYFGAVRAVITSATPTNLVVTVPAGGTYAPITETVNGLTAYSGQPFQPTFTGSGQINSSSLGTPLVLPTGIGPGQVVLGDFDGDGRVDLVIADGGAADLSIYQNISTNGTLAFAPRLVIPMMPGNGFNPFSVAVADMDGDGKLDIVAINAASNLVSVVRNVSSPGLLTTNSFAPRIDFSGGNGMRGVTTRDLNGDGRPDIAVVDWNDNTVSVFQNQSTIGNISFATRQYFAVGSNPSDVAVADLDGDGYPDLAVANMNGATISVLRNLGAGGNIAGDSFAPQVVFATPGQCYDVKIGDVDGDDKPDILTANWAGNISVLRNLTSGPGITTGSFAPHVDFSLGGWGNGIALGDLDGDGLPDIAAVSQINSLLSLFHNASTPGSFTIESLSNRVDFASGYNPAHVVLGDLNGDGKPDVVFGNDYSSNVFIYANIVPSSTSPTITVQPQDTYVYASGTASFSVTATEASGYQWLFNGSNILNGTSSTLSLSNIVQSELGQYSVIVGNGFGSVTSSVANLFMYPSIITPFTGLVTDWGQNTTLSITAWGSGPLTFQWYDNGVALLNATNSTLTFSAIQFTNAGSYSVVVSSSLGSVTNAPAQLVVNPAGAALGLYPGITVSGTAGYSYIIQSNPDLTNTNGWTTVASLTLFQPVQLWVDINNNAASPTNQHRFYRVLPAP